MARYGGAIVAGLIALAAVLGVWRVQRDDALTPYREKGLRIGYAVEAPYAWVTPEGLVSGESPSLARLVASRLDIDRIEWIQTRFDALIPDLRAGRFDVIAAGMFITAERAKRVAFSEPTFRVLPALLVARGNPQRIHRAADLKPASVRVAVLSGSVEQAWVKRIGVASDNAVLVPDALTGLRAVQGGLVEALALSAPTLRWMAQSADGRGVEVVTLTSEQDSGVDGLGAGYGAFAFRPQDAPLREAWNGVLRGLVGQPEHLALVAPWGFSAAEMPGDVRLAELLNSAP